MGHPGWSGRARHDQPRAAARRGTRHDGGRRDGQRRTVPDVAGARGGDRRETGRILRLLLLVLTCGLAGVVVGAMVIPVGAGIGLAAKAGADSFEQLPQDLLQPRLAQRSLLVDKTGRQIAVLHGAEDRLPVTITQVPDVMKRAIVAIEDSRFYEHHGVDFQGVGRALVRNGQGSDRQGGSTLTQQYVKNVLLESAKTPQERAGAIAPTVSRKLREARYALELERQLSKDQILERYLNITYFGEGVYGVGLAAQHYFKVRVEQLSLPQAALLAGLVNSPTRFDPFASPAAATTRRDLVLRRMLDLGLITTTEHDTAVATPVPAKAPRVAPSDACEGSQTADGVSTAFFCDYARRTLLADTHFGATQPERDRGVYDGGLVVRTTLDPAVQKAAQEAVDAALPRGDRVAGIVAVVEPGTGAVLAIAANRTYSGKKKLGFTKIALADQPIFHGGSTFKAFTLAAALKEGIPLGTKIAAKPCYTPDPLRFDTPAAKGRCPLGFQNSEAAEGGIFTLLTGTWFSVNTFYIQLEERVGVQSVIDTAVDMGVRSSDFDELPPSRGRLGPRSLSVTLGAIPRGVSALEMATAYATLAAHGIECDPHPLSRVADTAGKPVAVDHARPCRRVLDVGIADTVTSVLAGVLTQKGATAQGKGLADRPAAGKTGTLDDQAAAWFVGFTPQLATAVVLGDTAASSMPLGMVQGVFPVYGGTIPASIWQATMTAASVGKPVLPLAAADPAVAAGQTGAVPDVTGLPVFAAGQALVAAGYGWRWGGASEPSVAPVGSVSHTVPAAGSPAPPGTEVQLVTGNGAAPAAAPVAPVAPVVPVVPVAPSGSASIPPAGSAPAGSAPAAVPPRAPAPTTSAPPTPDAVPPPPAPTSAAAAPPPPGRGRPPRRP